MVKKRKMIRGARVLRACREKHRGRRTNESMEDGSEWTQKHRKTNTDVEICFSKGIKGKGLQI